MLLGGGSNASERERKSQWRVVQSHDARPFRVERNTMGFRLSPSKTAVENPAHLAHLQVRSWSGRYLEAPDSWRPSSWAISTPPPARC
jgi:hypothetical protein